MRVLLLFALLLTALPARSAPAPLTPLAPVADAAAPDSAERIGTYRNAEATLYVARSGPRLVLTLAGQDAFDAFASAPANARLNGRAEALLRDAFAGDTDRLADALPAPFGTAGVRDFARLLGAFTDRLGPAASVRALGTAATPDGDATYVRVRFADSDEVLKLTWRGGYLVRITRSALPQVTAYPIRGSERQFAVLGTDGEPDTFLAFDDEGVTARSASHTFVAARSF